MHGKRILPPGLFGAFDVVPVGLVYRNGIGHLHDPPLDPLQFIAGTCKHDQQEKIDHGMNDRFGLANSYCFEYDDIKICRIKNISCICCFFTQTSKTTTCSHTSNENAFIISDFVHPNSVA